ncbi:MAG: flavin-dependent monooxygenase QhpG [Alphaproteobacteria bacterium]
MPQKTEITVIGAGPAGAVTAILLARRGYDVLMLSRVGGLPRIEGFSQRVLEVLDAHGLGEALSAVGPPVGREAVWNGEAAARNLEYATERNAFDAGLWRDAEANGVRCLQTTKVSLAGDSEAPLVRAVGAGGEAFENAPRFLVEARGRAAPYGRARPIVGAETTALTRRIEGHELEPGTMVEAFADGWAWYVCDGERAFLQIFVDSAGGLPKRAALAALFDAHAAKLVETNAAIAPGRPAGPVSTRNAAPRLAGRILAGSGIRVGDAASAPDPLSGNGVFAALGSALSAAAVVHTSIQTPDNRALAQRFYEERTQDGFLRFARVGRDFYAMEERWAARKFWAARAKWPDAEPPHAPIAGGGMRIEPRPVVEDGLIVERDVVVTADQPRGIWRVDSVPLAELIAHLRAIEGEGVAERAPGLAQRLGVGQANLSVALDWLRSRRVLAGGDTVAIDLDSIALKGEKGAGG